MNETHPNMLLLNMRKLIEKLLSGAGATPMDAGLGMGQADLQVEFEGIEYEIQITLSPTEEELKAQD